MPWVHLVIGLALVEFLFFGIAVGRARARYGVHAPATTGHEVFERYFRVHMNTLEQLVVFVPSILLFARYANPALAAALGAIFLVGRLLYFNRYVADPRKRELGFVLSMLPTVILLVGGIIGAIRALLSG
ncbi:MAG TPA: MAPEG family protein [Steroidobacteraceae bacterium]|nr:MAPEG family protein [Steroidobacteraceae bacterium]